MSGPAIVLSDAELSLLLWAVEGQRTAHDDDPEAFPLGDWDDLEYRLDEQYRDMIHSNAKWGGRSSAWARRNVEVLDALLAKLTRD